MKSFSKGRKIAVVVTLVLSLPLLYISLIASRATDSAPGIIRNGEDADRYGSPVRLGDLENQSVKESSGIAASEQNANIFWTHNDSGDGPFIYAFDRQGKHRGAWRVTGAESRDWEDMAIGPGPKRAQPYIYIGDIGDNAKVRDQITVYRVAEPALSLEDSSSATPNPRATDPADVIRLKYPDGKHDAEALLVHPSTGDLYIVTKEGGGTAGVYKLKAPFSGTAVFTLAQVGQVQCANMLGGFITGGDISRDGRWVILCDYLGACELALPDKRGVGFDEVWKQPPTPVNIGTRRQGEAICYRADGLALLATSEGLPCPLIEIPRRIRER